MAGEELGDAVSHLVSQHLKDLEDAVSASERYIEEFKATKRSTFVPNPEQLAVAEEVLREVLEEHERRWAELKAGVDYVHEKLKQSFQHSPPCWEGFLTLPYPSWMSLASVWVIWKMKWPHWHCKRNSSHSVFRKSSCSAGV